MADTDSVSICFDCMIPVEGCRRCPLCRGSLKRIGSLGFEILRKLKRKGYKPVSCKFLGYSGNREVSIEFDGYSPGRGVHGEMRPQLSKEGRPTCTTWRVKSKLEVYREADEWVEESTEFSRQLPFNRDLCSLCAEQFDVEWFHGRCRCPCAGLLDSDKPGATGPHEFWKGLPDRCIYLAEQVMTRPDIIRSLGLEVSP